MTDNLRKVRSVALAMKEGNAVSLETGARVESWLRERGVSVWASVHSGCARFCEELPGVDLLLVLGGDGSIVSLGRGIMGRGIPLAGVNCGRVGFLAELSLDTWEQGLTCVLENGFGVEERMTLRFSVMRKGENTFQGEVINDVVISRGRLARLLHLNLKVDDKPFMALRSDGLILSTPTGSSGYACSAGGSLLQPSMASYVVAAICPFLCGFPPLVLGADTEFSVSVGEAGAEMHLTLDGQITHPLVAGDTLCVRGEPGRFLVADLGMAGYFERLRRVGFVHQA